MFNLIQSYTHWLHGQWPAGLVEKLPLLNADGTTTLKGCYVVGDLTGIPLLKFSSHTGANAIKNICKEEDFTQRSTFDGVVDVAIIGGGVSGYAAALEAKKQGLSYTLIETSEPFSTIKNFPKGKPIFTFPSNMRPEGDLNFESDVDTREALLSHLETTVADKDIAVTEGKASHIERKDGLLHVPINNEEKVKAHRVIVAIGRSGNFRKLNVPGEEKDKVLNRLHDPSIFSDKNILVVGGGDSAVEAAIATAERGAKVSLSYRKPELSRPKPGNVEKLNILADQGKIDLQLNTTITEITDDSVSLKTKGGEISTIANDNVLTLIGREAPLDFFRRSKIPIAGEGTPLGWVAFALFFVFTIALYDWKNFGFLNNIWGLSAFPDSAPSLIGGLSEWWSSQVNDRSTIIGTIAMSMKSRSFYYTLLYTSCIGFFGWQRIKRRKTPYVTLQTWSLFLVQLIPLFLLPELLLPWLGYNGVFDAGWGKSIADSLFPSYISAEALLAHQWPEWGHPRAYWHAYGFILAWPLNVYNVFTPTPIWGWIIISVIQTFVIIPALIYKYGKGAYCGWICSCGALAETLGDTQRHKMPHGPFWNKLNMVGQVVLLVAFVLLAVRIFGWVFPESWASQSFNLLLKGENSDYKLVNPVSWKWVVDVLLGGILGVGMYFKYSGRVWCRFACPLAALMHIYARFSRFRIFADKKKCISCNVCTSVCHQGIDIMNFANKGRPMEDPECVRCSACVQSCPTGVLSFGEIDKTTGKVIKTDSLAASPVKMMEIIASDQPK